MLLIDQSEELFAASVSDAECNAFIELIAALAGTGRVWVVATLRADFYVRMLVQPGLKKLKELARPMTSRRPARSSLPRSCAARRSSGPCL